MYILKNLTVEVITIYALRGAVGSAGLAALDNPISAGGGKRGRIHKRLTKF